MGKKKRTKTYKPPMKVEDGIMQLLESETKENFNLAFSLLVGQGNSIEEVFLFCLDYLPNVCITPRNSIGNNVSFLESDVLGVWIVSFARYYSANRRSLGLLKVLIHGHMAGEFKSFEKRLPYYINHNTPDEQFFAWRRHSTKILDKSTKEYQTYTKPLIEITKKILKKNYQYICKQIAMSLQMYERKGRLNNK